VLIHDEPTAGLDPSQIRASRDLIRELGKQHTILLSTHILPEVEMTCDRVIIIHRGQIVASSPLRELARQAGEKTTLLADFDGAIDPTPVRAIAGVSHLEREKIPGGTRLRIATRQDGGDVTPRLCALAAEHGWKLRELRPHRRTLEELFVQIVDRDAVVEEAVPAGK
jgi:ABC-2 type transport system ATP-binding protein